MCETVTGTDEQVAFFLTAACVSAHQQAPPTHVWPGDAILGWSDIWTASNSDLSLPRQQQCSLLAVAPTAARANLSHSQCSTLQGIDPPDRGLKADSTTPDNRTGSLWQSSSAGDGAWHTVLQLETCMLMDSPSST